MVVYVDIVFLTNFFLDAAMLFAAAKARGVRPSLGRVALSSAIGASYVLFMFVPSLSGLYTFVVKCLFSIVMIMTAFGYKSFRRFAGLLAAFYLANAAAAGVVVGLHYALQSTHDVWSGILFTQTGARRYALGVSLWFAVGAAALGVFAFRKVFAGARRSRHKTDFMARVQVRIGTASFGCTGLIDSGNHLYDPLTRTPVMVTEASVWRGTIPEAWMDAIRAQETDRIAAILGGAGELSAAESDVCPFPWRERIRLVPFRGINGAGRLMLAVRPDEVTIRQGGTETSVSDVLVGIDGGTLSPDGAYQALIHPALLP